MDYNLYVQDAFRFLVRNVLSDVAKSGLSGETHFLITFETNRKDVHMPEWVRVKYPKQMSIILQHQFENLCVNETEFSVDLAFGGVPATLTVPYTALLQFADPSADFGFVFEPVRSAEPVAAGAEVIDLEAMRRK